MDAVAVLQAEHAGVLAVLAQLDRAGTAADQAWFVAGVRRHRVVRHGPARDDAGATGPRRLSRSSRMLPRAGASADQDRRWARWSRSLRDPPTGQPQTTWRPS